MARPLLFLLAPLMFAQFVRAEDPWVAAKGAVATLDWASARSRYADLAANSSRGSDTWTIATVGQATATQHLQPASKETIDEAVRLFGDVVSQSSNQAYIARSLMNLGRIAELPDYAGDSIDLDAARGWYEQVMRRWPDEPIGSEASLRASATLVMAFDGPNFVKTRAGVARLRQWLADHPNNPYAPVMWQYAGDTLFRPLGDYAAAMACYNQADRLGWPDWGNQGASYWRCARLADLYLHDRATAVRYYTNLLVNTPTHPKAYAARQRLMELHAQVPGPTVAPTTQPLAEGGQ